MNKPHMSSNTVLLLDLVKCNLTKLTTMSLALKRFTNLAVKRLTNLVVKQFISLAVKRFTSSAVKRFISLAVKQFVSLVLKRPTSSAGIQWSIPQGQAHMVRGSFVHCSYQRVCHQACSGAVHLASCPPPIPYFFSLPLFHQCDGCLEWGLMAGLWGFASHGGQYSI